MIFIIDDDRNLPRGFQILFKSGGLECCVFDKVDPKDARIDTFTNVNKILTLKLDSVSRELVKYVGVYNTIKEKVIHYNFDPSRAAYLIDSLKALRDSTSVLLGAVPKSTA